MEELADIFASVTASETSVFYDVCETPVWLCEAFGLDDVGPTQSWRRVQLSGETANAKIRKHAQIKTLEAMIDIIRASLSGDEIEARLSDRPNSIEVYLYIRGEPWLIVYKVTAINEIFVASVYRVSLRNLRKARGRPLVFGIELSF